MLTFAFYCAISLSADGSKLGYHDPYPFRTESGCMIVCSRIAQSFANVMGEEAVPECKGTVSLHLVFPVEPEEEN